MMKSFVKFAATAALVVTPVCALAAGSWNGPYVGAQVGINSSSASGGISSESALNTGLLGGYSQQLSDHFALGGDVFYEWNVQKSHNFAGFPAAKVGTNVYGADFMAGFPVGDNGAWMPFMKLGYGWADFRGTGGNGISNQNATRYGVGVAWRVDQSVDVNLQYMYQKFGGDASDWKNQNYTIGLTYYFQ